MTKDEAAQKIIDVLSTHTNLDAERAAYLAERLWSDVVVPAVNDERELWVDLAKRSELLDS